MDSLAVWPFGRSASLALPASTHRVCLSRRCPTQLYDRSVVPRISAERRQIFDEALAETGDYRQAARLAGIAERTGRRWRHEARVPRPSSFMSDADGSFEAIAPSATRFVGRRSELEALRALFDKGERLVTILGPPGIGKTRLAQEWAARHRPLAFRHESPTFCDLRGVSTREDFVTELAQRLGIRCNRTGHPAEEALARAIDARGPCLLILDNFEELVREGAPALALLWKQAPHVRLLVTSRALLNVHAEVAHELHPLSLPDEEEASDPWRHSEAMRLFCSRALAAEPSLSLSDLSNATVGRLVRHLDGLPLAIELAAPQLRQMGAGQLSETLTQRLLSLESVATDVDDHHRTLHAAIDHSYQLLSVDEQRAFVELVVFRSGFTTDAANAVWGTGRRTATRRLLARLRECSLVKPVSGPGGQRRWDVLEVLRQYAAGRLAESDIEGAVRQRHAAYYLAAGEKQVAELRSAEGMKARGGLQADLCNYQAAFDWLTTQDRTPQEELFRMALVLQAGLISWLPARAAEVATRALETRHDPTAPTGPASMPSALYRVRLLLYRAAARRDTGDVEGAAHDLDHAHRIVRRFPETSSSIRALLTGEVACEQGHLARCRGLMADARSALERALAAVEAMPIRDVEATHLEGRVRSALAVVAIEGFRDEKGLAEHNRAVAILEQTGDVSEIAWARYWRAIDGNMFESTASGSRTESIGRPDEPPRTSCPREQLLLRDRIDTVSRGGPRGSPTVHGPRFDPHGAPRLTGAALLRLHGRPDPRGTRTPR